MTTDTKPAPLSAARLAEIREADAAGPGPWATMDAFHDRRSLLAHVDALTPRAVDGDALGFGLFIGDMRETDNRATREAWAQMEPEPKAEYVSRALALVAIGYAAGCSEGAPVVHADFAGGLSVCARPGDTTKDVDRITCPTCLARLYDVANDDADKMRQEVERLTAAHVDALTPRAPSTREQRVERLGKLARELLQIAEDTVSEYLARDREFARLTSSLAAERARRPIEEAAIAEAQRELDTTRAELAEARSAVEHARMDVKMTSELQKMAEYDASVARLSGARGTDAQIAAVAEIAASIRWTRANSDNPGDQTVYVDRLLALFPEQGATPVEDEDGGQ